MANDGIQQIEYQTAQETQDAEALDDIPEVEYQRRKRSRIEQAEQQALDTGRSVASTIGGAASRASEYIKQKKAAYDADAPNRAARAAERQAQQQAQQQAQPPRSFVSSPPQYVQQAPPQPVQPTQMIFGGAAMPSIMGGTPSGSSFGVNPFGNIFAPPRQSQVPRRTGRMVRPTPSIGIFGNGGGISLFGQAPQRPGRIVIKSRKRKR